jgi:Amt family ammonium transporter
MGAALTIGVIAAILFQIIKNFLHRMEIDDPLNIVSIHLVCGLWGLIATGFF